MKKISTLFKKDPENLARVINEINPENSWVMIEGLGVPTRKFDGTACSIIEGVLYKRYDCKIDKGTGEYKKKIPPRAIPCQVADKITDHHPHWVPCDRNNQSDKYHWEAFDLGGEWMDGTFELYGKKVQGNPEKADGHFLIRHGVQELNIGGEYDFHTIKKYLEITDIEGIVFHHRTDSRMCKIRKSDFGIKR